MNIGSQTTLPLIPNVLPEVPQPACRRCALSIAIIGPGNVGSALLAQLRTVAPRLRATLDLQLRVTANSQQMWRDDEIDSQKPGQATDLVALGQDLARNPNALIIDCSASEQVVEHYHGWLNAGIHIATPNKLAMSGPLDRWQLICAARKGAQLRYEATVGAGLPVVQTLRDLLDTGDELLGIEGMFSGTLAWLFNQYDGQRPFSELVREAMALGYTEPDPRNDLDGMDVARKLVILAREAGHPLSLADVDIESLVPDALSQPVCNEFLQRLPELDSNLAKRYANACKNNQVLRHIGRLDNKGHASVRLLAIPRNHLFAHMRLTDNAVQFKTRRYCDNPLVIQGPGAGPEVTAAGVFGDILRIAAVLK